MDLVEEYDKLKTKVLKYIMYKKRTENEIKQKFSDQDEDILEEVIEELKELGYINDNNYIDKSVNEFIRLKNLSIKELSYKLYSKGINTSIVNDYIYNHKEELVDYEIQSAKNIIIKKANSMEKDELEKYLLKKGYMKESLSIAFEEA